MGLMQIPRRVDYGLRAVIYLSGQDPEKCCSMAEIATRQGVPRKFLEKIIQDLIRAGLIKSKRGSCGGYALARSAEEISFSDVIEAIETDIARPVVAANYAGLWSALTLANVRQPIRGHGKLLTCF